MSAIVSQVVETSEARRRRKKPTQEPQLEIEDSAALPEADPNLSLFRKVWQNGV